MKSRYSVVGGRRATTIVKFPRDTGGEVLAASALLFSQPQPGGIAFVAGIG